MNKENVIRDNDEIEVMMFGKKKLVKIVSTGDNQFDEEGNYKKDNFELTESEINCLNWFISNVRIDDYKNEILNYCNNSYEEIGGEPITIDDLENEINIYAIVINISESLEAENDCYYPQISFYGDCKCDPELGICIGFRNGKFLGIKPQTWTL